MLGDLTFCVPIVPSPNRSDIELFEHCFFPSTAIAVSAEACEAASADSRDDRQFHFFYELIQFLIVESLEPQ
jgi:hypothetical protein